jgi:formylglycine-generating enzyme required for sulfatase activity
MAGNMWEWCASWYDQSRDRPVIRGGSWFDDPVYLHASRRFWNFADYRLNLVGFRLVKDTP